MQHLVVADGHCSPKDTFRRFDLLGRLIIDRRPEKIINLGDLGTYDSVSFYEQEGRKPTLKEDLDATREATRRVFGPTHEYNRRQRIHRHSARVYDPDTYELGGNHEDRIQRRIDQDPYGLGSVVDFEQLLDFGVWKNRVAYGEYTVVDGIQYTHCPLNKMGRPITGLYRGLKIAKESYHPTVYGHTHEMDFSSSAMLGQANGVRWSLNAPAFMEHQHVEDYAKGTQTGWYYGVLILEPSMEPGVPPSIEYISMQKLERLYG